MANENEFDVRKKAIQLYLDGRGFNEVIKIVQRSNYWFAKWLKRYKEESWNGLRDQSRAPRKINKKTSQETVKEILRTRDELQAHKSRRSEFSGIGPEVIQWELKRSGFKDIPSVSTISRILNKHGRIRKTRRKRNSSNQPYPYIKAQKMGDLHQTDLVGPRHIRGPKGVVKFYSYHTIDVMGRTAFTSQFTDKRSITFCMHLIESWRNLGIPKVSQMDNEMSATGGGRYEFSISQLLRLHLLFGIEVVFIPPGEPGRNAMVESFNALWQERLLQRHHCPDLRTLRRKSERFLKYYHYDKPHRALTAKDNGTRLPGVLKDTLWPSLRHLPEEFDIQQYKNDKGELHFPIARGRISYIRKVDSSGRIDINGFFYFVRKKLEGQYVVATIFTHRKKLIIKHENKVVKSTPFPIEGRIVKPLSR